jgi:hypothetical protein
MRVSRAQKKKTSRVFLSDDIKPDTCMTISYQDIYFLFWIPFIWTACISVYVLHTDSEITIISYSLI